MNITESRKMIYYLLMIFLFGGVIGFVYEELFYLVDLGYLVKRGTTLGPWIPIYGFGCLFILFTTNRLRNKPLAVFFMAAAVSGILEFISGYILYHYAGGLRLWDYNVEIWNWFNIDGYVCLRSLIVFGAAGLILQYIAAPVFHKVIDEEKAKNIKYVLLALSVLFIIDVLFVSVVSFFK